MWLYTEPLKTGTELLLCCGVFESRRSSGAVPCIILCAFSSPTSLGHATWLDRSRHTASVYQTKHSDHEQVYPGHYHLKTGRICF